MILTWFKTLFIGSNCLSDVRVTQARFPEWRQSDASAFPWVTSEWRKRIYRAGVTLQPHSRPYYAARNNCALVRWVVPFIKLSAVPTFGSNINAFIIKLWCIILCAILTVTYCIILCYRMGCVLLWIHFTMIHSFQSNFRSVLTVLKWLRHMKVLSRVIDMDFSFMLCPTFVYNT